MATKKQPRYELAPGPDVDLDREEIRDRKGRRITQAYVDEAVADVHVKTSRGRPSLTGRASTSPQVTFRLPPALREAAEAQAPRGRHQDIGGRPQGFRGVPQAASERVVTLALSIVERTRCYGLLLAVGTARAQLSSAPHEIRRTSREPVDPG